MTTALQPNSPDDNIAGDRLRRLLMLAYFFPPDTSGGVTRTVKFIKYLHRLGWQTTVLAPDWHQAGRTQGNAAAADSIPAEGEVLRIGLAGDESRLWKSLHRLPLFWRVESAVKGALQYPDRFAKWADDVLPVARRVLERKEHLVLYSTSPPETSHYIALQLKGEFGIPWVADFRDPWTDNVLMYGSPPAWRKRIDLRLEHRVYAAADRIIANTEANRAVLIERHGVPPRKIVTITNGYDEEDFARVSSVPPSDRFRITYCGSFYSTYNPAAFLTALSKFLAREPGARVSLTLAGSACDWARENIHDPNLSDRLELLGQIPSREIFQLLAASHLLLHTYPAGIAYSVPGKLYEYLRSGRPIVAVCDRPSEVATLLEQTGRGRAFRPDETDELAEYLRTAYADWTQQRETPRAATDDKIQAYERGILTQRLADVFESLVEQSA